MPKTLRELTEELTLRDEALLKSEKRYRGLFEGMTEGFALRKIIRNDQGELEDYEFLEINPAFEKIIGVKKEDLIGKRTKDIFPHEYTFWVDLYGKMGDLSPIKIEQYFETNGKWLEIYAYSPAPDHFATILTDITERKMHEEDIKDSERLFRTAFCVNPIPMSLTTIEGEFVKVNQAFCMTAHMEEGELVGRNINDFRFYPSQEIREEMIKELFKNGSVKNKTMVFHLPHSSILTVFSAVLVKIKKMPYILGVILIKEEVCVEDSHRRDRRETDKKLLEGKTNDNIL